MNNSILGSKPTNYNITMEAVARLFIKIKRKEWPPQRFIVCTDPETHTWTNELGNSFRIPPSKFSYYTTIDWEPHRNPSN